MEAGSGKLGGEIRNSEGDWGAKRKNWQAHKMERGQILINSIATNGQLIIF